MALKIIQKFMTNNDCFKAGKKITPKGVLVHSTATPGVMAAAWFNRWNKPASQQGGRQVCVHAFLDDKECFQYLPWDHRGWHGGGSSNNTHIGFEICEPGGFKYGGGVTMIGYDVKANQAYFDAIWKNTIELCVKLCKEFKLTEKDIIDHQEGNKLGIASNHADVMHWFPKHGKNMNMLRAEVKKALETKTPSQATGSLHRVQTGAFGVKGNADRLEAKLKAQGFDTYIVKVGNLYKVQVGAFGVRSNAEAMLKRLKAAGYDAFITT